MQTTYFSLAAAYSWLFRHALSGQKLTLVFSGGQRLVLSCGDDLPDISQRDREIIKYRLGSLLQQLSWKVQETSGHANQVTE